MNNTTGATPLAGQLSDEIAEAVLRSPHPSGRSEAIVNIIQEICEAIAWLHGAQAAEHDELASLHQLLAEAHAHRQRMEVHPPIEIVDDLRAS